MPLWKTGSTASRPKTANSKTIRGTISGPIPIPGPLDDDEFPIRNPGTGIATTSLAANDDEFPIRKPGYGIASPVPPPEDGSDTTPPPLGEQAGQSLQDPEPDAETESKVEIEPEYDPLHPPPPVAESSASADAPPETTETAPEPAVDLVPPMPAHQPEPPPEPVTAPTEPLPRVDRTSAPSGSPPRATHVREFSLVSTPVKSAPQDENSNDVPARSSPSRRSPPRVSAPGPSRQTNPSSNLRYSTVSETLTGPSTNSKDNKDGPSRKKSTLRSTFSKLFGRNKKKKNSRVLSTNRASTHISELQEPSQHHSDSAACKTAKESEPKRSASLPINELDRPLRSHSIGPHDIIAIESARNSLQGDGKPPRRRAATAISGGLFLSPRRDGEWGAGLSPRPASTQGRGNRVQDEEDPDEIGRAITSDSGHEFSEGSNGQRRRSRSLSGLNDYAQGRGGARRRSDEIRYWRESYDPGFLSPLSSNAQEDNETTGGVDVDPESPLLDRPPKTPPQPFNFGSITKDMVGMKITQAASIDTRIGSLESRAKKMERVVTQLCHAVPGFKSPLVDASTRGEPSAEQQGFAFSSTSPPKIPAIYQAKSSDAKRAARESSSAHSLETDAHSQISFGEAPTFIGSLHPPSSSATQSQSLTSTAPPVINSLNRPTSTSTVRGAASLPIMGREPGEGSSLTAEDHAGLVAQLDAERAARLALEAQVKKLSDRVNALSTTMFAMVGGPAKSRSQERLVPPIPTEGVTQASKPRPLKTLSVFEISDDENQEKQPLTSPREDERTDDESLAEYFQTPREERYPQFAYGAFGEELVDQGDDDDDDPKRKKAARTLSLSQLTLKKGVQK